MEPEFAYEKKIGIHQQVSNDIPFLLNMIERLISCMRESNKINGVSCEFFRLDYRQPYLDEQFQFPYGYLILELKWRSRKELIEKGILKNDLDQC